MTKDGEVSWQEGCLSFPELFLTVSSPMTLTLSYLDKSFRPQQETLEGLEAICAHHEIMHLEGNLIIDRFEGDLAVKIKEIREKWLSRGTLSSDQQIYLESLEKIIKS